MKSLPMSPNWNNKIKSYWIDHKLTSVAARLGLPFLVYAGKASQRCTQSATCPLDSGDGVPGTLKAFCGLTHLILTTTA